MISIKISQRDGYWYVDVKPTPAAAFKAYSRHVDLDQALEQVRLIALTNEVTL